MKNQTKMISKNVANLATIMIIVVVASSCSIETRGNSTSSITAPTAAFDFFSRIHERNEGLPPESEWNFLKIWNRIADNPPTYVPDGYSGELPRTDLEGTWFIDKRDGKQIFVPHSKVGKYNPSVLLGEAKKVTNWQY